MNSLIARLKAIITANTQEQVMLVPQQVTKHQRFIDVLIACHSAGVQNLIVCNGMPTDHF